MNRKKPSFKVAVTGVMSALAIALNFLESLMPASAFLPPGAKLGLSNVVVMTAAVQFGMPYAVTIALIKSLFVLITRGAVAFFMSAAGGILSAFVISIIVKIKNQPFGCMGIGIIGALAHNLGQLGAAVVLLGEGAVISYGPYMFIFALVAGTFTGALLKFALPVVLRLEDKN